MQDIISFVNEHLCGEEDYPHHFDWHDPQHAARVGFFNDESPPRRLAGVAKSAPWKAIPAQVGLPGDATQRRRSTWIVGSDRWNHSTGEDCPHTQEIHALAALAAAKITLGCGIRPPSEQHWRGLVLSEELASGYIQVKRGLVVQTIWYIVTAYNTATKTPLMGTPAKTLDHLNKVVVGFLNGGRTKGYVYDFSALNESFNLLPQEDPLQGQEIKVALKDLKAVFFVWEFAGNPEDHDSLHTGAPMGGRTIEVTFTDGEKIVGRTEGHSLQPIGFFLYPANPKGNNIRIFVVTRNTRQVRLV